MSIDLIKTKGHPMQIIKKLNPYTRKRLLELVQVENFKVKDACKILGISEFTYYYWKKRAIIDRQNFKDLPNTPKSFYRKTPKSLERIVVIMRDRLNLSSIKIHFELKNRGIINPSTSCFLSESAIRAIFKRYRRGYKFDKLKCPKVKVIRYEKQFPGELAHIDVKKIRKIKGDNNQKRYEVLLIDDCTRLSYAEIIPDKTAQTLSDFLKTASTYFVENYNLKFKRLMSDNGTEFTTRYRKNLTLHLFEATCKTLGIKHIYTKPYHPQTNGKVERIWRTIDTEFYSKKWLLSPEHRDKEFAKWIEKYNKYRVHLGIKGITPYQKYLDLTCVTDSESNQNFLQAKEVVNL